MTEVQTEQGRETRGFQAEVQKLLHLMIHSLYSNREIFLRELVSNASDAADRLRFEAIGDTSLLEDDPVLRISIAVDADRKTITVTDNGIGMSRDEVIQHLGTIARSGTGEFLSRMTGDQRNDANLIGQFGVGFYSSFIVAGQVEVLTRKAGLPATEGVRWQSDGQGEFHVETVHRPARGTEVTLHLREDALEFADEQRVRALIRRYSDHIAFPVCMTKAREGGEGSGEEETVNAAQALWTRPRSEISDEEYRGFYNHVSHDFREPLAWSHNRVEGRREYTCLLYIPAHAPWDLWNRTAPRGLKLYVKRVFIMDDAEQFLPLYLRFVRGVVDSADLPLNVSRELLQQDAAVESMRAALVKRVLDMLERMAAEEPEKYATFWAQFGRVLKEGPAEDPGNSQRIAKLLRFSTTHTGQETPDQSLADYVSRKQTGQKYIWYVCAQGFQAARSSPHLEVFRKRGIEVLLLGEPIDEWLMTHLHAFEDLEFRDVKRGELKLDDEAASTDDIDGETDTLVSRIKAELGGQVSDVRVTRRLTESAACLVVGEHDPGEQLCLLMKAAGQPVPDALPVLEINPVHPLLRRLAAEQVAERTTDLALLIFDQACLANGGQLADPGAFVQRLNRILLQEAGNRDAGAKA